MNITQTLQELDDLIIEHPQPPVTTILRNKLHPLREQIEAFIEAKEKEAERASEHNIANLQLQIEHDALKAAQVAKDSDPFKEHRGVLFKRKPEGGFHEAAYCVTCRGLMGCDHPSKFFSCPKCGTSAQFTGYHFPEVLDEVTSLSA